MLRRKEASSKTMPQWRTDSNSGTTSSPSPGSIWKDLEKEGANLLRCISPQRLFNTPNSDRHPNKRRCKYWKVETVKNMADNPTSFRDLQPVRENKNVLKTNTTQGTQLSRKKKRKKHAAEKNLTRSDKVMDSDGEGIEGAFSDKFSSGLQLTKEKSETEQSVNETDPHITLVDTHQSGLLKTAKSEQNTQQQMHAMDRPKTLVSENRNGKTKEKHGLRVLLQTQPAISQLSTLRSLDSQQAAKSMGFTRASKLIARFEAKRMQHIRMKRTSCKSSKILFDHAKTPKQETSFGHHSPSTSLTTSTSDSKSSTRCVDSLTHIAPTPMRCCSVKERIANFSTKQQKRIHERRFSLESTRPYSSNRKDGTAHVDCRTSASKQEPIRVPEPDSQDLMYCIEQEPTQELRFHGVKERIASFEEKQQSCNNRPRMKRLGSGDDRSTQQGPGIFSDCGQERAPDADQHAATSLFMNPGELESPALTKNKPTGETNCHIVDKSKSNHNKSLCESQVHLRNAGKSLFCSDWQVKTALTSQTHPSPPAMNIHPAGSTARRTCTQLLRRSNKRRHNSEESFLESLTDTSSFISHSSSDSTAQQLPSSESTACTWKANHSDSFKSSLVSVIQALNAKPVHRKHRRRKRETQVSSSESEKLTSRDSVDVPSVDGRPAKPQSPTVLSASRSFTSSQIFGCDGFAVNARRLLKRRKASNVPERLFSSSEDTDLDVASAKAASKEFLRENPDFGDEDGEEVAAECNNLDSWGCIFGKEGSKTKRVCDGKFIGLIDRHEVCGGDEVRCGDKGGDAADFADADGGGNKDGDCNNDTIIAGIDEHGANFSSFGDEESRHNDSKSGWHHNRYSEESARRVDNHNKSLGSRVVSSKLDVLEFGNTSDESIAVENVIEEVEDPRSQKSKETSSEIEQNQLACKTKPQNGVTQQEFRNSKKPVLKKKKVIRKEKEGIMVDCYNWLNGHKLVYKNKIKAKEISRDVTTGTCSSKDDKNRLTKPNKSKITHKDRTSGNNDKLKKSKGDNKKEKQTMPNGETQLIMSGVMMGTNLSKKGGLITDIDNRLKGYKQRYRYKKNEETKSTCEDRSTRKCSSRDDKLKKSKAGGKKKKKLALLTTCSDTIRAVAVKEGHASRINENGENCQRMVSAFPVEWEDPLLPGMQQHMHRQYLQDRFFKLLLKRSRETQLTHRQSKKRSNKKQRGRSRHGMSVKKVTAKLQKDGWINYETIPEIFVLQDPKRFIQKLKTK